MKNLIRDQKLNIIDLTFKLINWLFTEYQLLTLHILSCCFLYMDFFSRNINNVHGMTKKFSHNHGHPT